MADLRQLMRRYCEGDGQAFRALYARVAAPLHGYLMRLARSRTLADDLLQQTFLKIHRARGAYVVGADPIPWMFAIAHRTFLDEARRQQRAKLFVGADPHRAEPPVDSELVRAAIDALAELPPRQQEAVVLIKLEGRSFAEAARIAGTTVGAMKVRAHRGYEALRKRLARLDR